MPRRESEERIVAGLRPGKHVLAHEQGGLNHFRVTRYFDLMDVIIQRRCIVPHLQIQSPKPPVGIGHKAAMRIGLEILTEESDSIVERLLLDFLGSFYLIGGRRGVRARTVPRIITRSPEVAPG
jgi:hypothetical protein